LSIPIDNIHIHNDTQIPLRRALDSLYGHLASNDMIGGAEEETMPGVGGEFFPYVFLTVATAPVLVG